MQFVEMKVIDLTQDIHIKIPQKKVRSRTDEELKKCSIFNIQFSNNVLKEAQSDAEQQIISHAFEEFPNDHDEFCLRLFDMDWFLEKYETIFETTKKIVNTDPLSEQGPTKKIKLSPPSQILLENKSNNPLQNSTTDLKYKEPAITHFSTYSPWICPSLVNVEPKVPHHANNSSLPLYTGAPTFNSTDYLPHASYNCSNSYGIAPSREKPNQQVQLTPSPKLRSNTNRKIEQKRKKTGKKSNKEILFKVVDYVENVLRELRNMCHKDENSIRIDDIMKLLNDRGFDILN